MKLVELLKIANRAYPDGFLSEYFDPETGEGVQGSGDTLAQFIVRELGDTFADPEDDADTQLETAINALDAAKVDLLNVIDMLEGVRLEKQNDGS